MRRKPTFRELVILLLAAAGGVSLLFLKRPVTYPDAVDYAQLPDGSTLVLHAVTHGKQLEGNLPSKRMNYDFLPKAILDLFKEYGIIAEKQVEFDWKHNNSLTLWMTRHKGMWSDRNVGFEWWADTRAMGERGGTFRPTSTKLVSRAYERGGSSRGFSHPSKPGLIMDLPDPFPVAVCGFKEFPRRSEMFEVKFFDPHGVVAKLQVPNPLSKTYPDWKPLPLPQTNSLSGIDVVLENIEGWLETAKLEEEIESRFHRLPKGFEARTDPRKGDSKISISKRKVSVALKVRKNARPTEEWEILGVSMFDPTGNSYTIGSRNSRHCNLNPYEGAWKVRTILARTAYAEFTKSESVGLKGVKIPSELTVNRLNRSKTVRGDRFRVRLLAAVGRGAYQIQGKDLPKAFKSVNDKNSHQLRLQPANSGADLSFDGSLWADSGGIAQGKFHYHFDGEVSSKSPFLIVEVLDSNYAQNEVRPDSFDWPGLSHVRLQDGFGLTAWTSDANREQILALGKERLGTLHFIALDKSQTQSPTKLGLAIHKKRVTEFLVEPPADFRKK